MQELSTLAVGLLVLVVAVYLFSHFQQTPSKKKTQMPASDATTGDQKKKAFAVPDPSTLAPPRSDPISLADLKAHDGSDPSKPIWLAIKGTVYDVSSKREVYGPGGSYHVLAGKDASRALGKSSLDPADAVADYSVLDEGDRKVLDDWEVYFSKRYNRIGVVMSSPTDDDSAGK